MKRPTAGDEQIGELPGRPWRLPEREYRYAAIDLLACHVGRLDLSAVAPLLALAQREPWWETVDGLAGIVGDVVRAGRCSDPDAQLTMDAVNCADP